MQLPVIASNRSPLEMIIHFSCSYINVGVGSKLSKWGRGSKGEGGKAPKPPAFYNLMCSIFFWLYTVDIKTDGVTTYTGGALMMQTTESLHAPRCKAPKPP